MDVSILGPNNHYHLRVCSLPWFYIPAIKLSGGVFTLALAWNMHFREKRISATKSLNLQTAFFLQCSIFTDPVRISCVIFGNNGFDILWHASPDSKIHGANMGPTWVLSALDGPHVCPMNLAIREGDMELHKSVIIPPDYCWHVPSDPYITRSCVLQVASRQCRASFECLSER